MSEHDDRVPLPTESKEAAENMVGTGRVLEEFSCEICGLEAPYEVFDDRPPKKGVTRTIRYREKCYIMQDPFRPQSERLPLVVGAPCSECEKKMVCMDCSLFFSRRFCVKCVRRYESDFPHQLGKEIKKLKEHYSKVKEQSKIDKIEASRSGKSKK